MLSIREFNANVSKAIARVEAGETIAIMKNGKVVAELRPRSEERSPEWQVAYDGSLAAMREGLDLRIGKVAHEDKYGDRA
ncbi:type II toxin-antitoxin system Phd/YefM family antitoxin [Sphingoaurantiacus capsulatus]|uniref:Type II toxin-antitoxin system Phd/YefM family antitoxin n=1 Tax=Sphingoaurantiacus capsulatus TaxID=1771310 RepID=A0ABV7X7S4_9SPHN